MLGLNTAILAQEEVSEVKDFIPDPAELLIGLLAFLVLFFFTWKWVLPRFREVLDERGRSIRGEMERAEQARKEADELQAQYREQIADARNEANRIIEEARSTAEQLRKDLQSKAEEQAQATVSRAQDEIRAERDRVFEELRGEVGAIAVQIAERVVGEALDRKAHERLIEESIDELGARTNGKGGSGGA